MVKCLPCRHEDLNSDSPPPTQKAEHWHTHTPVVQCSDCILTIKFVLNQRTELAKISHRDFGGVRK